MIKTPPVDAGDMGSIPGLGRYSGEGNGNPLQYTCLRNPMDRGICQATVHGVTKVGHNLTTRQQLYSGNVLGAGDTSGTETSSMSS